MAKRVRTVKADTDRKMEVHFRANELKRSKLFGRRPLQRRGIGTYLFMIEIGRTFFIDDMPVPSKVYLVTGQTNLGGITKLSSRKEKSFRDFLLIR